MHRRDAAFPWRDRHEVDSRPSGSPGDEASRWRHRKATTVVAVAYRAPAAEVPSASTGLTSAWCSRLPDERSRSAAPHQTFNRRYRWPGGGVDGITRAGASARHGHARTTASGRLLGDVLV